MGNLSVHASAADVASFVKCLGPAYQRDSELIAQFGINGALLASAQDLKALFGFMEFSSTLTLRQTVLDSYFKAFKAALQTSPAGQLEYKHIFILPSESEVRGACLSVLLCCVSG